MPKVVSPKTVQRHFPPTTNRCVFKPERLIIRSVITSQQVFPLTEDSAGAALAPSFASTSTSQELIAKPAGEVGRPGRNSYSLEDTLKWGKGLYAEIQVIEAFIVVDPTNKLARK